MLMFEQFIPRVPKCRLGMIPLRSVTFSFLFFFNRGLFVSRYFGLLCYARPIGIFALACTCNYDGLKERLQCLRVAKLVRLGTVVYFILFFIRGCVAGLPRMAFLRKVLRPGQKLGEAPASSSASPSPVPHPVRSYDDEPLSVRCLSLIGTYSPQALAKGMRGAH